jgi:cell division protein ZapA (FtsZ GTPase activity inhibitor)
MNIVLSIGGQEISLDCAPAEERRLRDLAAALEVRIAGLSAPRDIRGFALTALCLLDETQAVRAALVRAQDEIERLTDMIAEARLAPAAISIDDNLGRCRTLYSNA